MQDRNQRFTQFQINLCYLFDSAEMVFIQHMLDIDYLKRSGYNTNWSKAFLMKKMNIGERGFDRCVKKMESLCLINCISNKGSKTRYYWNRELYLRLVRIVNSTNDIDSLSVFCREAFIEQGRSIEEITDQEIEELSNTKSSFKYETGVKPDSLAPSLYSFLGNTDPYSSDFQQADFEYNCESGCKMKEVCQLATTMLRSIRNLTGESCKYLPQIAVSLPAKCSESDRDLQVEQLQNAVHNNKEIKEENNNVFPEGKNKIFNEIEMEAVGREMRNRFPESQRFAGLEVIRYFEELKLEYEIDPNITLQQLFPLFEYYGAGVVVRYDKNEAVE